MRPDSISLVAKSDSLICLYGETLLNKHKRQQMSVVVSNKIREMGRLLLALKSINSNISVLFDFLKYFETLITATKLISGYDQSLKKFKAPSLALHMGTNLKIVCDIALKIVIEKKKMPDINWVDREETKTAIKEIKKLIEGHWCNELSSLALKDLKEKQWEKPAKLPLTSDIQAFQSYLSAHAEDAYEYIKDNLNVKQNYKTLTECVLALVVMFNRKRIGDVQYLKIETYNNARASTNNQEAFVESLTPVEQIICKKLKRVLTGGKGSKPIPILFPQRIQKYITCLIKLREDSAIVPTNNPYLFANPGSENRWMSGVHVISKMAKKCGAQNPSLLTSTKFRKHIATTLQLMTLEQNEMDQIATFMGHTKKTHEEFYRLPQDIYQTAKVAKILLLLNKGRGKEFKGKSLNDIQLENTIYYSSESENEEEGTSSLPPIINNNLGEGNSPSENTSFRNKQNLKRKRLNSDETEDYLPNIEENVLRNEETAQPCSSSKKEKITGRVRWSNTEKSIVTKYFSKHIKNKIAPKKHECEELLARHKDTLINKDWLRIKTLVYNTFREK
ncbi:hypothetical protein Zmor_010712 [Zophobas morio]|uniref:Uncharacterized protein n=1 Tax=Zophobas morio TaxID=2755281 RepID=A0AA38MK51_9CUCU|nr:hypothetical protein Zmor_010712 [Zophobas morio]